MPASKRRGGCGGENPTPKTTPECWLAISEELTDLQLCMEMLEGAGYGADPVAAADQRAASSYAGANGWTTINQEETGREEKEMTRKRFKKLLMSEHFDRNEANFWADYYPELWRSAWRKTTPKPAPCWKP